MAQGGGALFAGCVCQTAYLYSSGAGKEVVKKKFREQIEIFLENDVDILIAEVRTTVRSWRNDCSKKKLIKFSGKSAL